MSTAISITFYLSVVSPVKFVGREMELDLFILEFYPSTGLLILCLWLYTFHKDIGMDRLFIYWSTQYSRKACSYSYKERFPLWSAMLHELCPWAPKRKRCTTYKCSWLTHPFRIMLTFPRFEFAYVNISYSDMNNQTRQFQRNILSMLHLLLLQNQLPLSMETNASI